MARGKNTSERKTRSALTDVVAREYTIHLHTKVHGQGFKHRAPTAVKAVKAFAQKTMGTKKVVLEPSLNSAIWGKGIKNVPHRIRVRLHRKRNDDEDAPADEKLYTYASFVDCKEFKGLQTTVVDTEE
ncbi:hypothetical protein JCM21900_002133 [Sporobolomyces salmonicolor]